MIFGPTIFSMSGISNSRNFFKGESVDQIFNELSLSGAHSDKYAALQAMSEVCKASAALGDIGFNRSVRTTEDFATRELARGYTYNDWLMDKNNPSEFREIRAFMLSRCSKSPYVESLCREHGMTELEEYRFSEGSLCLGLALAHMWGIPALSLAGDSRFANDQVAFFRNIMDENGNISSEKCHVLLLSRKADVTRHEKNIRNCLFPDTPNGLALLEQSATTLPYLAFCGDAPRQLGSMDGNDMYFRTIVKILRSLNEAMRLVEECGAEFMPQEIQYIARESDSTMQMPKTRAARTFLCPDGESRLFVEHVRINIALRVQLFSHKPNRKVYIGHVGEHLPTARF